MARKWTPAETEAFVGFVDEMVIDGHRADNGQFRFGTFQLLANKMHDKFPDCCTDKGHAKNKHKRLKEKYQTAVNMLSCSDFARNEAKQCVEVDSKQVFEIWLKVTCIQNMFTAFVYNLDFLIVYLMLLFLIAELVFTTEKWMQVLHSRKAFPTLSQAGI